MTPSRSRRARRACLSDQKATYLTSTRTSRALPDAVSAALRRTVLKPCLDFDLNLASPPAPRPWPATESTHALGS